MIALAPAILDVISEGMKFINEKNRTKIQRDYFKLLSDISEAENTENYNDIDLSLLKEDLIIFLKAFKQELRNAN